MRMIVPLVAAVILLFNTTFCSASESPILGYLDPGSGAMIFQMIIASVVGAGVALKLFWLQRAMKLRRECPHACQTHCIVLTNCVHLALAVPTNLESQNCARSHCSLQQLHFKIWLKQAWRTWIWGSCGICQTLASHAHRKTTVASRICAERWGVSQQKRNGNINDFHSLLST